MLSYSEVGEILSLIDKSSCDEVVLETGDLKLVVRRKSAAGGPPEQGAPAASAESAPVPVAKTEKPMKPPAAATPTQGDGEIVSAPMVGTFYRATSPEEPPLVEVSSKVEPGDPLCVIEVMKLFTTIHAETAGTVAQIGPGDAELVEYGQMLFVLDPA